MGRGWRIVYSPKVIDFINRVNREGLAEVRWSTTWQQDAHRELAPAVGLDAFPAYDDPKIHVVRRLVETTIVLSEVAKSKRPVIWTDDDLHRSSAELVDRGVSNCLVKPDANSGLSDSDLAGIERFLDICRIQSCQADHGAKR